ncbi:hypothetical protein [Herbaspirillum sp. ST 5-3]|uniref:hypothetical protein n=1 Tax=Oxalobacteraceae TaxID=75682 RepID=UPI0010A304F7|nr:hypothetical protein [Herbaspirillum sp. ST 5-3]
MFHIYEGRNAVLMYAISVIIGVPLMLSFDSDGRYFDAALTGAVSAFSAWRIVAIGRGKKWEL